MATRDASEAQQQTALVVAAHPDDIESWCAGTVAGLARSGWRVVYILCTSGEKGTSDPYETPQAVAALREQEQREAARIVGADVLVFLRLGDGELEDGRELLGLLVRAIRRHRPQLLITHDRCIPGRRTPPIVTTASPGGSRSTPPIPMPVTRSTSTNKSPTRG